MIKMRKIIFGVLIVLVLSVMVGALGGTKDITNLALNGKAYACDYYQNYYANYTNDKENQTANQKPTYWAVEKTACDGQPWATVHLNGDHYIDNVQVNWNNVYYATKFQLGVKVNGTWIIKNITGSGQGPDFYYAWMHNVTDIGIRLQNGPEFGYAIADLKGWGY